MPLLIPIAVLLAVLHTTASIVLKGPNPADLRNRYLILCPPGFIYPDKRTYCFRIFRPSKPVSFDKASWACSLYNFGNLAYVKPFDDYSLLRYVERNAGLGLPEGKVQRVWIGIRRESWDQPFVSVALNFSVNMTEYRLQSAEIRSEACAYWDLVKKRFDTAACNDEQTVDGFVCQARFELYTFCDMELIDRSQCCSQYSRKIGRKGFSTNTLDAKTCTRTVTEKAIADKHLACAINSTCVLHPPMNASSVLFPSLSNGRCRVYCVDDTDPRPRSVACDNVVIETEEDCECEGHEANGKMPAPCRLESVTSPASNDTHTNYAIAIGCLTCFIVLGLLALIVRRKRSKDHAWQDRLVNDFAMEQESM